MGIDQTAEEEIVTVTVAGAVGVITLRTPALSRAAKEQLLAGATRLSRYDAVRAVVGLSATLTRAVGTARASELILLGEPFTAQQALDWGLVGRLADPGSVLHEALALASRLADGPTLAYAEAKKAIQAAALPALPAVLETERAAQSRLGQTADHRGAVAAFLARQRPVFGGR